MREMKTPVNCTNLNSSFKIKKFHAIKHLKPFILIKNNKITREKRIFKLEIIFNLNTNLVFKRKSIGIIQ